MKGTVLKRWEDIPEGFQNDYVRAYYDILQQKRFSLFCKRIFDIFVSFLMIILLSPFFLITAVAVKLDSKGPVFFRQERITSYGETFRIFKFRTMVNNADKLGTGVTINLDRRVTDLGRKLRRLHLDEIPQLFDVFLGRMSFVGTRPEIPKFVEAYTDEMKATLLMPAGITSLASIIYQDERVLLSEGQDIDEVYITKILPAKMEWNLYQLKHFSFWGDIKIMFQTIYSVLNKKYRPAYLQERETGKDSLMDLDK